jgi:hypothetical protein
MNKSYFLFLVCFAMNMCNAIIAMNENQITITKTTKRKKRARSLDESLLRRHHEYLSDENKTLQNHLERAHSMCAYYFRKELINNNQVEQLKKFNQSISYAYQKQLQEKRELEDKSETMTHNANLHYAKIINLNKKIEQLQKEYIQLGAQLAKANNDTHNTLIENTLEILNEQINQQKSFQPQLGFITAIIAFAFYLICPQINI